MLAALRDFFDGTDLGYTPADVTNPDWIIQLGVAPVRIDIMSSIPGLDDFGAAWRKGVAGSFGAVSARYVGLEDLVAAKEASARPQDRVDLRALARARTAGGTTRRRRAKAGDEASA